MNTVHVSKQAKVGNCIETVMENGFRISVESKYLKTVKFREDYVYFYGFNFINVNGGVHKWKRLAGGDTPIQTVLTDFVFEIEEVAHLESEDMFIERYEELKNAMVDLEEDTCVYFDKKGSYFFCIRISKKYS